MSNGWRHLPQRQMAPSGGAVLQTGQAKPSRRGALAIFNIARACIKPLQQFMRMNAAMMPIQMDCANNAYAIMPATPMRPMMLAIIKLLARPKGNHNSERRIWPPSSG